MELQTHEILSILPTKGNIETIANGIAYEVNEGNIDPIEAIVKITAVKDLCEVSRTKIEDAVLDNLDLYKGSRGFEGAKVERCEVGVKYSFQHDSKWNELKAEADKANEALKKHESILKTIPAGKMLVDDDSGETFIGASKTSKTSFKITLGR